MLACIACAQIVAKAFFPDHKRQYLDTTLVTNHPSHDYYFSQRGGAEGSHSAAAGGGGAMSHNAESRDYTNGFPTDTSAVYSGAPFTAPPLPRDRY